MHPRLAIVVLTLTLLTGCGRGGKRIDTGGGGSDGSLLASLPGAALQALSDVDLVYSLACDAASDKLASAAITAEPTETPKIASTMTLKFPSNKVKDVKTGYYCTLRISAKDADKLEGRFTWRGAKGRLFEATAIKVEASRKLLLTLQSLHTDKNDKKFTANLIAQLPEGADLSAATSTAELACTGIASKPMTTPDFSKLEVSLAFELSQSLFVVESSCDVNISLGAVTYSGPVKVRAGQSDLGKVLLKKKDAGPVTDDGSLEVETRFGEACSKWDQATAQCITSATNPTATLAGTFKSACVNATNNSYVYAYAFDNSKKSGSFVKEIFATADCSGESKKETIDFTYSALSGSSVDFQGLTVTNSANATYYLRYDVTAGILKISDWKNNTATAENAPFVDVSFKKI